MQTDIKDKNIDDRNFGGKGSEESIRTSKAMKEENDEKRDLECRKFIR